MDEHINKNDAEERGRYRISFMQKSEDAPLVHNLVKKCGGEIFIEEPVVKTRLEYKIGKENFAFLGEIRFFADPSAIIKIQEELRFSDEVIRFMVDKEKKQPKSDDISRKRAQRRPFRSEERKKESGELSNEALEKKIEEILQ